MPDTTRRVDDKFIGGILITKGGGSYRNSLNHAMKSAVFSWYSGSCFADNLLLYRGKLKSGDLFRHFYAIFAAVYFLHAGALAD
ncbi:hypothetical protein ABN09_02680, partial [Morganella morganii]